MLKETETEETIVFFVAFLSLVAFQLGGPRPPGPPLATPMYVSAEACEFVGLFLLNDSSKLIGKNNAERYRDGGLDVVDQDVVGPQLDRILEQVHEIFMKR